ncbi:MAG: hypothetical protein KF763_12370 [Cyclobacteriaceae bacterium]|nr:hypothetical protein [Cyclobacteriaceae bacterium]
MTFTFNKTILKRVQQVSVLILCLAFPFLSGCNNDPELKETDRVKAILIDGAWTMQSVLVSGVDQTAVYIGLQINFSATGYTAQHGGSVWPASGTWEFTDETAKTIMRNDGLSVSIVQLEQKKLVLGLTWNKTTFGSGRVNSVSGAHTFTLVRP